MKKIIFLLMSCFALSAFAGASFTTNEVTLTDANNNPIAKVTKGTKVKVVKEEGNKTLVKVEGWSYEEEPNLEIFSAIGETVTLTVIEESKVKMRKILEKKADQYEDVWLKNSIEGWVVTASLTEDFKALWSMESSFASERCGACHSEPRPANYTAVQFPSLINSMKETAGLSDEEEAFVVNYYQKNKIYGKK